jgi:uncharacterized protein (DUF433 family)
MKKQNLKKELSPILENEHMQIGTFKANREINSYSIINNNINIIRDNIKFWQSYDGHKLPEKQVKRAYYNGTRTQNIIKLYRDTPELIKFVREHANDYKTLNRKDIPNCITFKSDYYTGTRYFSVFIEKFGEISFKEVLNVFPLLPKLYLNE